MSSVMLTDERVIETLRRTWQPVARSAELPVGRVIGYTLLQVELVVARFANGTVLAADIACPHKGARLALLRC